MRKAKLIAIVIICILTIILFAQNAETAQANILFWSVRMSRALLLLLTFVFGFVVGISVPAYFLRKRRARP